MDKPALTKDDRELFHYNPNTDDIIERVKAYGEAMAKWGAEQERERLSANLRDIREAIKTAEHGKVDHDHT